MAALAVALGVRGKDGTQIMFVYEKRLQYPVKIKTPNPALAKFIMSQYGGPDGELGASLRYLSQRYTMPYPELRGLLTDIGTEEAKVGSGAVSEVSSSPESPYILAFCIA